MADALPLKLVDLGGGQGELREFAAGDTTPITQGGTGATTAAQARLNLGAGTSSFSGAWADLTGKPVVIAAGADQATARTAIGAGTSSFSGKWADLTGAATAPTAAYRAGDVQIANMAALLAQAGNLKSYNYVGSPAAILANQSGVMLLLGQSGTYTMPSAGSIPAGDAFYFSANSDGTVISIGSDAFAPGGGSTATLNAGESITLVSAGPGFWIRLSDTTRLNKATANALAAKADQSALAAHTSNGSNPHGVTKAQVGLSRANDTSDLEKPISTATQAALNGKADLSGPSFTGEVGLAPTSYVGDGTTKAHLGNSTPVTLANGAELVFQASGVFFINDHDNGALSIFTCGAGVSSMLLGDQARLSTTKDTAGKMNMYFDGSTGRYRLQNMKGTAVSVVVLFIKTRNSV